MEETPHDKKIKLKKRKKEKQTRNNESCSHSIDLKTIKTDKPTKE